MPTALTIVTGPPSGSYAGFADRPVDPTEINAYYAWQSLVGLAVPAAVVALACLFWGGWRRPAAAVAAVVLALLAVVAVFGAVARGLLPYPLPAVPTIVAWLYVPCFAASAIALWLSRRNTPASTGSSNGSA